MMAGFSRGPASFLAFFSFFTSALCLRLSGRESRRRTRDVNCVGLGVSGLGGGWCMLVGAIDLVRPSRASTHPHPHTPTPTHQGQEFLGLEVEQLVEVDAAEGELLEGALLAGLRDARHLLLRSSIG